MSCFPCLFRGSDSSAGSTLKVAAPRGGGGVDGQPTTPGPRPSHNADSVHGTFAHARSMLRDIHSFRLGSELALRHTADGGGDGLLTPADTTGSSPSPAPALLPKKRPVRVTTCVALGTDASGAKCMNQYVKVRKLAQGSYGKVVLYTSREDGRLYAIKVLSKAHLGRKHVGPGTTALADAMREVALLQVLDHPNIVRLIELIDDPGEERVYVVLEYLERGPVHQDGAPPLDQATAAAAVADVAAALAYCHWQGVAHCDVKPDNMLTGSDGITRLIDFSVSQLLPPPGGAGGDNLLQDGSHAAVFMRTPGTPAYTAPECCIGGEFDGTAADVWALGISLFTMLTGAPPFVGHTLMETYTRIQGEARPQPPGLEDSTPVGRLLQRMLEKDPRRRATIADVLADPWVAAAAKRRVTHN